MIDGFLNLSLSNINRTHKAKYFAYQTAINCFQFIDHNNLILVNKLGEIFKFDLSSRKLVRQKGIGQGFGFF